MDFFQAQDKARRNSKMLVLWFLLAVVGIIATVYLALVVTSEVVLTDTSLPQAMASSALWQPELFLMSAGGVGGLILLGSLFKTWSLSRNGGAKIAEELGGRLVSRSSDDPLERRLVNVVDEMAIAAGMAAPPVYIMDAEQSINAFAAGARPTEAVVAVTRGCLEKLSRDELQGVVAHEFSHILNGDMRLNLRLLGLLHGILLLTLAGRILMRSSRGSSRSAGPLIIGGIAMVIVGYMGVLFGKIIKAGVSRQREYLADAAAVQFTRNPQGIAGALKKIAGIGSSIDHPRAEEASHMFFGSSMRFAGLFATHPPVGQRIKRLDPSFKPETLASTPDTGVQAKAANGLNQFSAAQFTAQVGDPQPEHVTHSRELIAGIPEHIKSLAHQMSGARAIVLALLLPQAYELRQKSISHLRKQFGDLLQAEIESVGNWLSGAEASQRLPLIDMALPTLRELPQDARRQIVDAAEYLIKADGRTSLFEFVMRRLLRDTLTERRTIGSGAVSLKQLLADTNALLSLLALAGHGSVEEAEAAFAAATQVAPLDGPWALSQQRKLSTREFDRVLDHLAATGAPFRRRLIEACATVVMHDGQVTNAEAELLRAVCQALDCPSPPLLSR